MSPRERGARAVPPADPVELAQVRCGVQAVMLRNLADLVERSGVPLLAKDEQGVSMLLAIRGFMKPRRRTVAR